MEKVKISKRAKIAKEHSTQKRLIKTPSNTEIWSYSKLMKFLATNIKVAHYYTSSKGRGLSGFYIILNEKITIGDTSFSHIFIKNHTNENNVLTIYGTKITNSFDVKLSRHTIRVEHVSESELAEILLLINHTNLVNKYK